MSTGDKEDMANRVEGKFIASEFLGSLETDVFEVAPRQYVHVEQHRHAQDRVYKVGEREILCWHAESGILLEELAAAAGIARRGLIAAWTDSILFRLGEVGLYPLLV